MDRRSFVKRVGLAAIIALIAPKVFAAKNSDRDLFVEEMEALVETYLGVDGSVWIKDYKSNRMMVTVFIPLKTKDKTYVPPLAKRMWIVNAMPMKYGVIYGCQAIDANSTRLEMNAAKQKAEDSLHNALYEAYDKGMNNG